MSDRPEDYTDPDPTDRTESSGPSEPVAAPRLDRQDAGPGPAEWGGYGTPGASGGHWPGEQAAGQAQGADGEAQGGGYPHGGYPQGPHGPYGYGPYGYGPGGPGGWPGAPWAGGPWGWGPSGSGWEPQMQVPTAGGPRRRGPVAVIAAGLVVLALLLGVAIGYGVWKGGSGTPTSGRTLLPGGTAKSTFTTTSARSTAGTKVSSATGAPSNIATIRGKVAPELVDINTVLGYETEDAAGTGMVLTATGKVLTNNHVIEGATKISVTDLGNAKTYAATVLGYTRTDDIAVIQLKGASGLKTVHIGNSSSVKVGEAVVGIGNAGGTGGEPSAAGGSVTALDQSITASDEGSLGPTVEHLTGLIQSNADIVPGDSGGPLVTTSGAVVGMDTAASEEEGYSIQGAVTGQGYSIPIDEAIATARQIVARKASTSVHIGGTAFLGVYVGDTTSRTRSNGFGFGNTVTFTSRTPPTTSGAVVEGVISNTPAQRSGLAEGDVITSVDGTAVTDASGLTKILLQHHPGDQVKVAWRTSSGQTETATVTLASGPPD